MLALRIQPEGADILIDGDHWPSGKDTEEFVVHLPVGKHHIQIRIDGYESFVMEVEVDPGKTTRLYVKLPPLGSRGD